MLLESAIAELCRIGNTYSGELAQGVLLSHSQTWTQQKHHICPPECPQKNDDNSPHRDATHVSINSTMNEFAAAVQSLSCVQLFVTPWTAACQASLSITNS